MMIPIGVFLMSMTDYYIPAISGAPFPVLGVVLVWLSCRAFHGARRLEIILGFLILLGAAVGSWRGVADPNIEIWPTNLVGWFLGFTMMMTDLDGKRADLERAFCTFLLIHVGFFYAQAFTYVLSEYYIDPLSWFTGEPSRYMAEDITTFTSIFSIRPTGLFLEPSHYAVHVLPVSLIYYTHRARLSPLVLATLASVALTFSSWAFVAVALSSIFFINRSRSNLLIIGGLVAFVVIFYSWFVTRTFEMQYDSGSTPAEFRWIFAEIVLGEAADFSPGLGIGVRDASLGQLSEFTVNDSGSAIYFFYVFGAYALVLLVALFWTGRGWRNKVLLALILTSKLMPTYPFFWLLMNVMTRDSNVAAPRAYRELAGPGLGDLGHQTKNDPHDLTTSSVTAAKPETGSSHGFLIREPWRRVSMGFSYARVPDK